MIKLYSTVQYSTVQYSSNANNGPLLWHLFNYLILGQSTRKMRRDEGPTIEFFLISSEIRMINYIVGYLSLLQ